MEFADRVLDGRIRGRNYSVARLKTWAIEVWGQHLVDIPFVQTFVRGWFALRFTRVDHTNWVLSSYWHFEHAPVLLKHWTPLFDPETEQIGIGPIWIQLLDLPLQYWSEDIFRRIGNAIGSFMDYDKSYQHTGMMAYVRILINLDTRGGLQEFITIQWRDTACKKIIDYEGIPYCCRRCHKVGHLFKDCPLLRKSRENVQEGESEHPLDHPPWQNTEKNQAELAKDDGEPQDPPDNAKVASLPPSPAPVDTATEQEDIALTGMLFSSPSPLPPVFCISDGISSHHIICTSPLSAHLTSVALHKTRGLTPPSSLIFSLPLPSPASSPCLPSLISSSHISPHPTPTDISLILSSIPIEGQRIRCHWSGL